MTEVQVALLASAIGASVTFGGDLWLRRHSEQAAYQQMLDFLCRELRLVFETVDVRLQRKVIDAFLEPPLPVQAWQAFNIAGMGARLDAGTLSTLQSFYWTVEAANYRAALVPMLLQTAILAPTEEASETYRDYAQRAAVEPFTVVLSQKDQVLELLPEVGVVPGMQP